MRTIKSLIASIRSDADLERLYQHRKQTEPELHNRSRGTLILLTVFLAFGFTYFFGIMGNRNIDDYLSKESILLADPNQIDLRMSAPTKQSCANTFHCQQLLEESKNSWEVTSSAQLKEDYGTLGASSPKDTFTLLMQISSSGFQSPVGSEALRHVFPYLLYKTAYVFKGDGQLIRSFYSSQAISLTQTDIDSGNGTVSIVFQVTGIQLRKFKHSGAFFSTTEKDFVAYQRHLNRNRTQNSGRSGELARIVLAIFCILLFLIVDSSPESKGLALFMGFDAAAIALNTRDFRELFGLDVHNTRFIRNYAYCMGSIFLLYFCLQMARVLPKQVKSWFIYGSMFAVPYALLRHYAPEYYFSHWVHIWVIRDLAIGAIATLFCTRSAVYLQKKGLPWRVAALYLVSIALCWKFYYALAQYVPGIKEWGYYYSLLSIMETGSSYMFALGSFLSISTLENRVRTLVSENERALILQRDLELGRAVQKSFLGVPKLPTQLKVHCHYEAASYVSGDSYFVHFDNSRNVLTLLLNDVTGHGVQAALKAFASHIIAKSIWQSHADEEIHDRRRVDRRVAESPLVRYDQVVSQLIGQGGDGLSDFNALTGVEFDLSKKVLTLYRVNYVFPIILSPDFAWTDVDASGDEKWTVQPLAIHNQKLHKTTLSPGSLVILVSDGYAGSTNQQGKIVQYLRNWTQGKSQDLSPEKLVTALHDFCDDAHIGDRDDRTMIIFQWDPLAKEEKDWGSFKLSSVG